ncbi:WD repeat-containing protein 25 [Neosynchiropus ocellatus]
MTSLVAYEDSDEEEGSAPGGPEPCELRDEPQNPQPSLKPPCLVPLVSAGPPVVEGSVQSSSTFSHSHGALWSSQKTGCRLQVPQSVHETPASSMKRPGGVRPYVPKRQRLVKTSAVLAPAEEPALAGDEPVLSQVSDRVSVHLTRECRAAEIPRRLVRSMCSHQGAVNTIQWCPVPQYSHLLLSASMDKTFKVWDGVESGQCRRVYSGHSAAVRDACWTPCGTRLVTGSFDNTAALTDVETGQQIVKLDNQFKVMCVSLHPGTPSVVVCGGYSPSVQAWDSRCNKVVKVYRAAVQQTLDLLFLRGGSELISSSDCVSRDSADRTLIAWDYETTARISNQIYHERFTCPSLALHPVDDVFVAQTNGNYLAVFSSLRPFRMNKRRQYEGHKVEGYGVQCDFSPDGSVLASGSSTGSAHFYDYHSGRLLHSLMAHQQPCLSVALHPVLPGTTASCDWSGEVKVWA